MRLRLATIALLASTSLAFAQGTVTQGGATQGTTTRGPAANVPSSTSTQPGVVPGAGPNSTTGTTAGTMGGSDATAVPPGNPTPTTSASQNPKAPVPGRNSFTRGQAMTRIKNAGFTDVSGLKLDNRGIWRGEAKKNGQSTSVALDYQGNVVGGAANQ